MDISRVDLPIHSFSYLILEITGSLLLRDLLYHIRPASDWARSNRTTAINKNTLFYSSEYKEFIINDPEEIALWKECTDESVVLDIRKDKFPYYVSTDFCWGCDYRTFASTIHSMKKSLPAIYECYGTLMLKALGLEYSDLPPGANNLFDSITVSNDADLLIQATSIGKADVEINENYDTVFIGYYGKGSLLSQFIRQHMCRVRTSFVNQIIGTEDFKELTKMRQDQCFSMQVITTIAGAKKLIATRACWFAKHDMDSRSSWSDIVTSLIHEFGGNIADYVPCKGDHNNCPWKTEQLARCIAGNPNGSKGEVNPPCPFITGLPEVIDIRKAKFGSNSSLFKLWEDQKSSFPESLTEHGDQYVRNVLKYGFAEACDNENPNIESILTQILLRLGKCGWTPDQTDESTNNKLEDSSSNTVE